jgi:hypothetical protein
MKIAHIFSDFKFLKEVEYFISKDFDNEVIFLGNQINNTSASIELRIFEKEDAIIDFILQYRPEIIILHSFDMAKARIAKRFHKQSKIGWRFYGLELYSHFQNDFITSETIKIINDQKIIKLFFRKIISLLINPKVAIRNKYNSARGTDTILNHIKYVHFFLGVIKAEWEYFSSRIENLPKFIELPIASFVDGMEANNPTHIDKELIVIVGNNQSTFNNHINIYNVIPPNSTAEYILPFSYNANNKEYSKQVEKLFTENKLRVSLIKDILPYEEYIVLFRKASTLLFASKRQMGLGNLLLAIHFGLKIYLPKDSFNFLWLQEKNFLVFDISCFDEKKCTLNSQEYEYNLKSLQLLKETSSIENFQLDLILNLNI